MFRNMVTSLLKHDRIKTTDAKAKELRRWADHIVTLAKQGDLNARRMAMAIVREKDVVHRFFEAAPERFGSIHGGYTRIVKIGRRPVDAAAMTLVELVSSDITKTGKTKKTKAKATDKPVVGVSPTTEAEAGMDEDKSAAVENGVTETADVDVSPVDTASGAAASEDDIEKASPTRSDSPETNQ
jgi:large subunit ribosomal protein L17